MDDLEKAILISFDESGSVDPTLKSQAVTYCQGIKETPNICRVCLKKLRSSNLVQVQFWSLQTIHEVVRVRYSLFGPEDKSFIRKSVFSLSVDDDGDNGVGGKHVNGGAVKVLEAPAFIKNKLAQVLVTLIYFEYPMVWSSVFVDLLPHLNKGTAVIDMFCRILNSLDEELISLDYPRSAEEMGAASRVKDAMRQQCAAQIVRACYDIVSMYRNSDPELCAGVLDCMGRYVSWIDIGLVVNDVFIPFLFELMLVDGGSEQLRGAAAGCILAVVSKRMDPQAKLMMLQSLRVSRVFGLVTRDSDSELVSRVAGLITGYATVVLECYKLLSTEDVKGVSLELLNEVLPSVFYVMQNCEVDTAFCTVHFLSSYVATLKSLSPLREKQLHHITKILEVIRGQIQYDPMYRDNLDLLDKIGIEEEDRMVEFRKDLFVLLRSVGRVAPDVTQTFIRNSLVSAVASPPERNVEEVEAALSLFYALGESLSDEAMRTGSGQLGELVPMLLSARFPGHANRLVALVYLETVSRYIKFVQENTQFVPMVLAVFLDDRGIHHSNIHVSRRASYLFMRVVKLLKSKLVPYIETILQSLHDIVARFTTLDLSSHQFSGSEDGSHIFEAIGLLIGMEDVPLEKQANYLSSLLTPLCHQVESLLINAKTLAPDETSSKIATIQQVIMAINAVSKGFSERLVTTSRPAIGRMFKQTLDILLRILIVFPKVEPLRSKVTSFTHRMVEILGAAVFPFLPKTLEQLLAESEPKEMTGFLILLNQLICKFGSSFYDILEELYPTIADRVFNVIPSDGFLSGPGTNTEEIRERQELQKTLYTFLHVIAMRDLCSVFLGLTSRKYLNPMTQLLLYTACNHKDIQLRKACVQIFIKLIKDWSTGPFGEEKVPGFKKFILEEFATKCCLYSVLDKSFDFRDANTLVVFGEIVEAQKVMYEKFGNDFLAHFLTKGLQSAHCPQDVMEQYCQKLQGSDFKALKQFYQSLVESLRHQQNGSLVFR